MRAVVRTKRPRRPPLAAATVQLASSSRPKLEKAQVPLTLPLKSFKLRLANGPPLAPTPKAFKSYAETCATLLRLCRATATATSHAAPASSSSSSSRLPLALSLHAHAVRSGVAADRSVASHLLTTYASFARAAERDRAFGVLVVVMY